MVFFIFACLIIFPIVLWARSSSGSQNDYQTSYTPLSIPATKYSVVKGFSKLMNLDIENLKFTPTEQFPADFEQKLQGMKVVSKKEFFGELVNVWEFKAEEFTKWYVLFNAPLSIELVKEWIDKCHTVLGTDMLMRDKFTHRDYETIMHYGWLKQWESANETVRADYIPNKKMFYFEIYKTY